MKIDQSNVHEVVSSLATYKHEADSPDKYERERAWKLRQAIQAGREAFGDVNIPADEEDEALIRRALIFNKVNHKKKDRTASAEETARVIEELFGE